MAKFWTSQELSEVLTRSSPHVRYLLWELFVKNEVPKEQLESKPVALAIVQRLCRSKGKDSLVISEKKNGDGVFYKLNGDYLEDFQHLLSKDIAPEKPKPRPKEEKVKRLPLMSTSLQSDGGQAPEKTKRRGKKSQVITEVELPLTAGTNFQFWFELVKQINQGANSNLSIISDGESALLRIS